MVSLLLSLAAVSSYVNYRRGYCRPHLGRIAWGHLGGHGAVAAGQ